MGASHTTVHIKELAQPQVADQKKKKILLIIPLLFDINNVEHYVPVNKYLIAKVHQDSTYK